MPGRIRYLRYGLQGMKTEELSIAAMRKLWRKQNGKRGKLAVQRKLSLHRRTIRRRRQAARVRMMLLVIFTMLIVVGIASASGALGGLSYGMPLYGGIKQFILGGIALGVGLGGRCAIG